MYLFWAIKIERYIEFLSQGGAANIPQIDENLRRRHFRTKQLLEQKLYDNKG